MEQKKGVSFLNLECEELLLTWFPLSALSPFLFMASYSSTRAVHRSLMYLVCGVGFLWSRLLRSMLQYDYFRVHP
jgi:hypothetical protein